MMLSIVSTLYCSSPFINEFHSRISKVAKSVACDDYEIILVDDGSPDNSLEIAKTLSEQDPHLVLVELSRNFGHHKAILAGMSQAQGDLVYLIDIDLEEQPEWLSDFKKELDETGADVVYGVQRQRTGSAFNNMTSALFWKILALTSDTKIPQNPTTCRLMKKSYVEAAISVQDRATFLAGTFAWAGFVQHPFYVDKTARVEKKSSYIFVKKIILALNSLLSFTTTPLIATFIGGVLISAMAMFFAFYLILHKLLNPDYVLMGFTSLLVSIWFIAGIVIMLLGVLGLYLAKIFQEVRHRPLYVVKNIYKRDCDG